MSGTLASVVATALPSSQVLANPDGRIQLFERPDGCFNISTEDAWRLKDLPLPDIGPIFWSRVERIERKEWWTADIVVGQWDIVYRIKAEDADALLRHPPLARKIRLWRRLESDQDWISFDVARQRMLTA
jgi:hypothetical protein